MQYFTHNRGSSVISFRSSKKAFWVFAGDGVTWGTINQPVTVDDDFTLLHAIVMLLVDAAIQAVFAWYVGLVWPGKNAKPLPWNFPFRVRETSIWRYVHLTIQYNKRILNIMLDVVILCRLQCFNCSVTMDYWLSVYVSLCVSVFSG